MSDSKLLFFTDDDQDDLMLMQEIMVSLGHKSQLFYSGEIMFCELEKTRDKPYMIFLDISMPQVDGFDILQKIRSHKKYDEIPIVIHSARCDDHCLDRAFDLGANYYISKAFSYIGVKASMIMAVETHWKSFKPQRAEFLYKHAS